MSFNIYYRAWNTANNDWELDDELNHTIAATINGVITAPSAKFEVDSDTGLYYAVYTDGELPEGARFALYGTSSTADVIISGESGVRPVTMRGTDGALTSLGANAPADWLNAAAIEDNAIAAAKIASSALAGKGDWSTHDADAVVTAINADATQTTQQSNIADILTDTGTTIPGLLGDGSVVVGTNQDKTGYALTAGERTSIGTAVRSALLGLFRLLTRKDAAAATDNAADLTSINADGGSGAGAYDNTTDAPEAIRDSMSTFDPATDEVDADVKKINGTTVSGSGTSGDKWGPA